MELEAQITDNLNAVAARIAAAAAAAGRAVTEIRLVAVSKTFGLAHVEAAVAAGLHDLGENKVQEALRKQAAASTLQVTWHLIGHLQSNKARKAVAAFDWIHSVDSVDLLRRLDRAASDCGRAPNLLIQVDLAGEATKQGAPEPEVRRIIDAADTCQSVAVRGLMVLPPWSQDPEAARPYFRRLRQLREELCAAGPDQSRLDQLSMGMSHDFEVAVEEGATMVRVGTALFGARPRTALAINEP
ncbi:MAG: YggS family pyridoxal phosphate-dependent enzyme [Vicinamibacterales bacterium]|jgi:pyridoxal phosphate enzyme (YggS family)|nr:YggS family pyridoxal phosphate-dependent enzyme [Vicinamibacterales bacterium]